MSGYSCYSGGGANYNAVLNPANSRFVKEAGITSDLVYEESYDGSVWGVSRDSTPIWKFDSAITLTANGYFHAYLHEAGQNTPETEANYDSHGNGTCNVLEGTIVTKMITEDFALSSVTRSDIESLNGITAQVTPGVTASSEVQNPNAGVGSSLSIWDNVLEDTTFYGVTCYAETTFSFTGTPQQGDDRNIRRVVGLSNMHIVLSNSINTQ